MAQQLPIRVMIVEDQPVMMDAIKTLFNAQTDLLIVGAFTTTREAVRQLSSTYPDVILYNLVVPLPELANSLKKFTSSTAPSLNGDQPPRQARVVGYIADGTFPYIRTSLDRGMLSYMTTHETGDALLAMVRAASLGNAYVSLVMKEAQALHADTPARLRDVEFTRRQREVLLLMTQGRDNQRIASILDIRLSTVKKHVHGILESLDALNRTEAVALTLKYHLLGDESVAAESQVRDQKDTAFSKSIPRERQPQK